MRKLCCLHLINLGSMFVIICHIKTCSGEFPTICLYPGYPLARWNFKREVQTGILSSGSIVASYYENRNKLVFDWPICLSADYIFFTFDLFSNFFRITYSLPSYQFQPRPFNTASCLDFKVLSSLWRIIAGRGGSNLILMTSENLQGNNVRLFSASFPKKAIWDPSILSK